MPLNTSVLKYLSSPGLQNSKKSLPRLTFTEKLLCVSHSVKYIHIQKNTYIYTEKNYEELY